MVIYKITNKINGKVYIGQTTVGIKERWQHHCAPSKGSKSVLSYSIQKYGRDNFIVEQLDTANNLEELNEKEKNWIGKLACLVPYGYNLESGGNNHICHEETRKKISKATKGIGKSKKHISAIVKAHSISVYQYNLNGIFITSYSSSMEASRVTKICNSDISKNCKLKKRQAGGFQWSFQLNEFIPPVRSKINAVKKGRVSPARKKVAKIDNKGNIVEVYQSAVEASLKNDCDHSGICKVCNGKLKHIKNMLFVFLENSR